MDIDLGSVIIQVKGGRARGIAAQIASTQASTGVRTVGYAPGVSDATVYSAAEQGIAILRTPEEVLIYLREFL